MEQEPVIAAPGLCDIRFSQPVLDLWKGVLLQPTVERPTASCEIEFAHKISMQFKFILCDSLTRNCHVKETGEHFRGCSQNQSKHPTF